MIQEVTLNGYKVVFPEYGNVEEVPLEYLQKKESVSLAKVKGCVVLYTTLDYHDYNRGRPFFSTLL